MTSTESRTKDYNPRSPAVRRILREAFELRESTYEYYAQPLEENIYEWHFTIRGPDDTDFQGGLYHGRILLPNEYPMKPPNFIFLTPNGRFDINRKICLNISGFHPESWQPCWSIRTVLLAIISFLPVPYDGSLGSVNYPVAERKKLAKLSRKFSCDGCPCKKIDEQLKPEPVKDEAHNSQWYKDFQVYIHNLTAEHSPPTESNQQNADSVPESQNSDVKTQESASQPSPGPVDTTAKSEIEPIVNKVPPVIQSSVPDSQTPNQVPGIVPNGTSVPERAQAPADECVATKRAPERVHVPETTYRAGNSLLEMLRGPTGEVILWLCFGLTLAIIMRRLILSFYGVE